MAGVANASRLACRILPRVQTRLSSTISRATIVFKKTSASPACLLPSQRLWNKQPSRTYADVSPLTKDFITSRAMLVLNLYDKIDSSKLTTESRFIEDLGLDSLDVVEIVMAMEDEFGFEIPDEDMEHLTTTQKVVQYIMDRFDVFE